MQPTALHVPAEMVNELALGMDPPYDVAARHGYDRRDLDALLDQDWFNTMVAMRRQQLMDDGVTFELKAKMMAEDLMQDAFKLAKAGGMTPSLLLDTTKMMMQAGGLLEKKQQAQTGPSGPAFQININVDKATIEAAPAQTRPQVIDVKAKEVAPPTLSIPLGPDVLPPRPAGFVMPDFKLTSDLSGRAEHRAQLA